MVEWHWDANGVFVDCGRTNCPECGQLEGVARRCIYDGDGFCLHPGVHSLEEPRVKARLKAAGLMVEFVDDPTMRPMEIRVKDWEPLGKPGTLEESVQELADWYAAHPEVEPPNE